MIGNDNGDHDDGYSSSELEEEEMNVTAGSKEKFFIR
jgi:hypothetical protein